MTETIYTYTAERQEQKLARVRELFLDPTAERNEAFEKLTKRTVATMQQIYCSGGNYELIHPAAREWLEQSLNGEGTQAALAEVLLREVDTRRFDHKFFGQIHPQGSEIGILSNLIAAFMNTNTIVKEVSIAENTMEQESLDWFAELFGYNLAEYSGNIVTGGTEANEIALWIARDKKIKELKDKNKWDPGMNLYVFASGMKHYSFKKICFKLGMENLELVETARGEDFRTNTDNMRVELIKRKIDPRRVVAVIGLAGETETGLVDRLDELADLAKDWGTWFHADAAYGGPFMLSKPELFKSIARANSITVDPHKMLYTPYPAGIILLQDKTDRALIEQGMREDAGYLAPEAARKEVDKSDENRNYGFSRCSGSMGTHGVISTWATIQAFGKEGLRALLDHTIELTKRADYLVKQSEVLEALHEPDINTLSISIVEGLLSNKARKDIVAEARGAAEKHGYYISSDDSILGSDRPAFRFVAMHPYSTTKEVDELIGILHDTVQAKVK